MLHVRSHGMWAYLALAVTVAMCLMRQTIKTHFAVTAKIHTSASGVVARQTILRRSTPPQYKLKNVSVFSFLPSLLPLNGVAETVLPFT